MDQINLAPPDTGREPRLGVTVGIATSGRPGILAETLADLAHQTEPPAEVLVLYGAESDVAGLPARFPRFRFLPGTGGLCEKRNRILDESAGADLILFIDDDFLLDPEYLRVVAEAFRRDATLAGATGAVLRDGARGPGLSVAEGKQALAGAGKKGVSAPRPAFNTYGCNMCFRMRTVREHELRFDEQLPAYGWYEDIDFSRRLIAHGRLMRLPAAQGVHLGVKVGRQSGYKLGYSQVANPVYLWRKKAYPFDHVLRSVARNFMANLLRSLKPETYVDRRGRLRGNLLAMRDALRGSMHPTRILSLH